MSNRITITDEMKNALMELLPQNADTAEGAIADWQLGRGWMPEVMAKQFPRLSALWHSESVRMALASSVTLETISDEQLNSIPE